MGYQDAYDISHEFEITNIVYEQDAVLDQMNVAEDADPANVASLPETIEFEYPAPAISVDTSGRFITHEVIGGTTVRQKIGEEPVEVSISGVCRESTAQKLDALRNAKYGTLISSRLTGLTLDVHFASVSTSPMDNAGAVDMKDNRGEFLYSFEISAVEVQFDQ